MLRPVSLLLLVAATLAGAWVQPAAALDSTDSTGPARTVGSARATTAFPMAVQTAAPMAHARPGKARAATDAPLAVTIDSLTPSVLPRSGPIRVSGSVTNLDDETWRTVNLYSFVSDVPMTTAAELSEQAATDAEAFVGERITSPGPYDTIDELAPGESETYSFSVPRSRISASLAGVYWFGVHALGESSAGRDDGADGRARTFLPLVPRRVGQVDTALVVPVRHSVVHDPDGRIGDLASWTRTLSMGGQLRRLADFGAAAGDRPLSWLIDPAVTEAVSRLAAGNPARSLAPTLTADGEGETPTADPSATDGSTAEPDGEEGDGETGDSDDGGGGDAADQDEADLEVARAGAAWLDRLLTGLDGKEVLGLPYGDVDVAGAAAHDPQAYRDARARARDRLPPWGLPTTPALSSPTGFVSPGALRLVEPAARILVSDEALGGSAPAVGHTDGRTLVFSSSAAASGGPGPDDPESPVEMRQRIVSEAALRVLTPGNKPLVVVLPSTWAPSSNAGFFDGLDLDWLHLTTVDVISQRSGRDVAADRLRYPDSQREAELDSLDFTVAGDLARAGETLQNLLTLNDQVAATIRDESLTGLSYSARRDAGRSRSSAIRSREWIEEQLRSVSVAAPRAVILSSGSGRFSATVTNGLDQPVTVRLDAVTDPALRVSVPRAPVEIGPGARTTILLNASSRAVGVRNLTLLLTDSDGTPLGSDDSLPIRSNRVSNVIWLILGTGVALLFATIVVRLFRRLRAAARS